MKPHERISAKLGKFRPSLTLELKRMAAERRAQNLPVYDFGLGETKGSLDDRTRDAGIAAYNDGATMYGDPAGLPELRRAVLKWLGVESHYDINNVVITAGAKQSLFNIFLAICNPGDSVLFGEAPWVSYQPLAVATYATPIMVLPTHAEHEFKKVTPEDLLRNIRLRPYARLFLLNNPVNPTAQLYDAAEVDAQQDVCVEHGIYFLLDRLYWRLVFDGKQFPEPRIDERTRPWLIQVDGLSKNFRRTGGLRIGWSVAPDDVSAAMINLQSHCTSGPALPTQHSALAAITRPYTGELRDELQRKRDLLPSAHRGHAARAHLAHAGHLLFLLGRGRRAGTQHTRRRVARGLGRDRRLPDPNRRRGHRERQRLHAGRLPAPVFRHAQRGHRGRDGRGAGRAGRVALTCCRTRRAGAHRALRVQVRC